MPGDPALVTWMIMCLAALCWWASFPPLNAWPLSVLAAALFIRQAHGAGRTRTAVLSAWVVMGLAWLWVARWSIDVSAAGYPVMAIYLGFYALLVAWFLRCFDRDPVLGRWPTAVTASLVIVAVECLRGLIIFGGYPWYFAGHPLVEWPLLVQMSDVVGAWWGSILVFAIGGLLVDVARPLRGRLGGSLVTVLLLLAVSLAYGGWRLNQEDVYATGPAVLAIQTNIPQDNKIGWRWEDQKQDVPGFIEMTRTAFEKSGHVDLVAWPETMVPGLGFEPGTLAALQQAGRGFEYLSTWPETVQALANRLDVPMLVGSSTWLDLDVIESEQGRQIEAGARYNSAALVLPGKQGARYDKVVLTPFGEQMPYISAWPWLEERLMAFGARGMSFNLDEGAAATVLDLPVPGGEVGIGTPICFEDTVPALCRELVYSDGTKQADLLINLSNDGWFGDLGPPRLAHALAARYRCIENRVPLVRVVNTGQTAAFDSSGRVLGQLENHVPGSLLVQPRLDQRHTIYGTVLGDTMAWVVFVLVLVLLAWTLRPSVRGAGG